MKSARSGDGSTTRRSKKESQNVFTISRGPANEPKYWSQSLKHSIIKWLYSVGTVLNFSKWQPNLYKTNKELFNLSIKIILSLYFLIYFFVDQTCQFVNLFIPFNFL